MSPTPDEVVPTRDRDVVQKFFERDANWLANEVMVVRAKLAAAEARATKAEAEAAQGRAIALRAADQAERLMFLEGSIRTTQAIADAARGRAEKAERERDDLRNQRDAAIRAHSAVEMERPTLDELDAVSAQMIVQRDRAERAEAALALAREVVEAKDAALTLAKKRLGEAEMWVAPYPETRGVNCRELEVKKDCGEAAKIVAAALALRIDADP